MGVAAVACAPAASPLTIRVMGSADGHSSARCFLELRSRVVGGGTETYCLERFTGRPGPGATVRSSGTMTFAVAGGSIRAAVHVVQRFGPDGAHATQTLRGTIVGGSGRYAARRGTISGGGRVVERPAAHIASSDLRYELALR